MHVQICDICAAERDRKKGGLRWEVGELQRVGDLVHVSKTRLRISAVPGLW